jgi:hypothetical protein
MPASENYGHLPARVARACSHLERELAIQVQSLPGPVVVRALQIMEKMRATENPTEQTRALAEFVVARSIDLNEDDPTELSSWAQATGAITIAALFDSAKAQEMNEVVVKFVRLLRAEGALVESLSAEATRLGAMAASTPEPSVARLISRRAQAYADSYGHAFHAIKLATQFEYGFGIADRALLTPKPWRGMEHRQREMAILEDLKWLDDVGVDRETLASIWYDSSDADAKRRLARSLLAASAGTSKKT